MSDTVKLIIEIPKVPKNDHERWVLAHGTPLDSNSDRAEVQAYFYGKAYGWEQGRKALIEDAKAEMEKAKHFHVGTFEDDNPIDYGIVEGFDKAIEILDNIGKESEE